MCDRGVSVFDRHRFLGQVAEAKPSLFEAVKQNGESLGLYNNQLAAAHALIAASRQNGGEAAMMGVRNDDN